MGSGEASLFDCSDSMSYSAKCIPINSTNDKGYRGNLTGQLNGTGLFFGGSIRWHATCRHTIRSTAECQSSRSESDYSPHGSRLWAFATVDRLDRRFCRKKYSLSPIDMSTTFAYHEDGTVGSLAIQPRAINSQASAIGPERRRSAGGGAHSTRRANAESTVHRKAIRTRHFPLESGPNRHKRQAGNELRATSRATKAGRRDIGARSCQLSAVSGER
jgi:hypothetical protein